MKKTQLFRSASLVAGALALMSPGLALAQSAGGDTAAHTIDEIVVTAQKREQSLQDVPIVVTSVNAQQIKDAGVRDIKDLTIVAPGLTVTSTVLQSGSYDAFLGQPRTYGVTLRYTY